MKKGQKRGTGHNYCYRCGLTPKTAETFCIHKANPGGFSDYCRFCSKAKYQQHKQKQREAYYLKRYGITVKEFDELLESQGGRCAICRTDNPGIVSCNRISAWQLDHDHVTGRIRGVLCQKCNRMLGLANDSIRVLISACLYLRGGSEVSVNRVILIGRLGGDPESRTTSSGVAVTNFSLATDSGSGDKRVTEWHRIVAWQKTAEFAAKYLKKGSEVYVEGRIQSRKWTDKESKEHTAYEIVAERLQFVGSKPAGTEAPAKAAEATAAEPAGPEISDEDIPF